MPLDDRIPTPTAEPTRGSRLSDPSRNAYGVISLLVIAFIVYGSLYPFQFHDRPWPGGTVSHLLTTWRDWDRPGDLLANILLYGPLGLFGVCALPGGFPVAFRIVLVIAGAVLLSIGMELAQFYDQGRDSTLGDVYANTIGAAAGASLATAIRAGMRWPLLRRLATDKPAALILLAWFGYRFYPYVPTIDLHKYIHALAALVVDPAPAVEDIVRFLLSWLLIATIVHRLYGFRGFAMLFPCVAGLEWFGRVLIIDATPTVKDIAGAVGAFAVGMILFRMPRHFWIMGLAFAGLILFERLAPFHFAATPSREFGLVPFQSFMQGSIGVDVQSFWEKYFVYGGMIWLLHRAGLRLTVATSLTAVALVICGWLQTYLPGRSAEITDAIMALAIGGMFRLVSRPQLV